MPIINSQSIIDAHTQPDGSRFVVERHTDSDGKVYDVHPYHAPPGFDVAARLAARAADLAEQLAQAEADALLGEI